MIPRGCSMMVIGAFLCAEGSADDADKARVNPLIVAVYTMTDTWPRR
jgi:hypothetical protein